MPLTCSKMVTSPSGQGVVLIGGLSNDGPISDFYELKGNTIESMMWVRMKQKLKIPRGNHVAFTIPNDLYKL